MAKISSTVHRRHESLTANTRPFTRPIRTTDSVRHRDLLLTTNARLTASPGNPIERGDMGKIWNGIDDGQESNGVGVAAVWNALQLGLSSLNAADLAEIKEKVARFGGGMRSTTSQQGITSFDSGRTTEDTRRSIDAGIDQIRRINEENRRVWDNIFSANDQAVHGRSR